MALLALICIELMVETLSSLVSCGQSTATLRQSGKTSEFETTRGLGECDRLFLRRIDPLFDLLHRYPPQMWADYRSRFASSGTPESRST